MFHHCLALEQLTRFVEVEIEGRKLYNDEIIIKELFSNWHTWDIELVCLTHLLSRVLERKQKDLANVQSILSSIFQISEEKGFIFTFEQINETFVNYMFEFDRQSTMDIDEQLIEIHNYLREYNY